MKIDLRKIVRLAISPDPNVVPFGRSPKPCEEGDRIELLEDLEGEEYNRTAPKKGSKGTVTHVNEVIMNRRPVQSFWQVKVDWDFMDEEGVGQDSVLMLSVPPDKIKIVR